MQSGRGAPIIGVRVSRALYEELMLDLALFNGGPLNSNRTLTEHVRALLTEGLRKRKASRSKRRAGRVAIPPNVAEDDPLRVDESQ